MREVLADVLVIIHFAFITGVIMGLLLVVIGFFRKWTWIKNPWFRSLHVAAIFLVIFDAWAGRMCPLTAWEDALREGGGRAAGESFIAYWLKLLIYYDFPGWVFTLVYTVFGGLVALMWLLAPPKRRGSGKNDGR